MEGLGWPSGRRQQLPDETKVNASKATTPRQLLENRFRGATGLSHARVKRDAENRLNDKPQPADRKAKAPKAHGRAERNRPMDMDASALEGYGGSGGPGSSSSGSGMPFDIGVFGQR